MVAVVCSPPSCSDLVPGVCVSKCCPEEEILLTDQPDKQARCGAPLHHHQLWDNEAEIHDTDLVRIPGTDDIVYSHHFLNTSLQRCKALLIQPRNTSHLLITNGSLYSQEEGFKSDFCIDNSVNAEGDVVEIVTECYHGDLKPEKLRGREESCLEKHAGTFRLVNTVSCSVSVVFLTITAGVYIFLPDLNNLHGKIILSNVLSITSFTVYLLFIYNTKYIFSNALCTFLGYFGYFSTMSMFCWMTIMSFDLCWMFRQPQVPRRDPMSRRFLVYSVVCWGSSMLITLGLFAVDNNDTVIPRYKPNIGRGKCFLQNSSHGIFLHLPIFVLMVVNGIFFLFAILVLYR